MNEDRTQKPQKQPPPPEWQPDLNPNHLAGQNLGQQSDARVESEWTAFHLRKRGLDLGAVNDEELKQVPLVAPGQRLQQGATYLDLTHQPREEFTARADMCAREEDAFAPKARVPYGIWRRLVGDPTP